MNEYRFLQSRELALLTKALGYTHTHTHPSIHAQVLQQTTPIFKIIGLLPWKHINTVSLFTNQILKLFSDLAGNAGDVKTHNECTQGHYCENMISCSCLAPHFHVCSGSLHESAKCTCSLSSWCLQVHAHMSSRKSHGQNDCAQTAIIAKL